MRLTQSESLNKASLQAISLDQMNLKIYSYWDYKNEMIKYVLLILKTLTSYSDVMYRVMILVMNACLLNKTNFEPGIER